MESKCTYYLLLTCIQIHSTITVRIRILVCSNGLPPCLHTRQRQWLQGVSTHTVEEAKLVSSSLSFPSRARPHLSRLLLRRGVSVKTLLMEKPGPTGQPSLQQHNHSSVTTTSRITAITTYYLLLLLHTSPAHQVIIVSSISLILCTTCVHSMKDVPQRDSLT